MSAKPTHGHARRGGRTPEYRAWLNLRERCNNPRHSSYRCVGAKGVKVCPAWQNSFVAFLSDLGPRPVGMWISRRNLSGDYSPENVLWERPAEASKRRKSQRTTNHAEGANDKPE